MERERLGPEDFFQTFKRKVWCFPTFLDEIQQGQPLKN